MKGFSPEFRNRVHLKLSYDPITNDVAQGIVRKLLEQIRSKIASEYSPNLSVSIHPDTVRSIALHNFKPENGGREIERNFDTALVAVEDYCDHVGLENLPKDVTATLEVAGTYGNYAFVLKDRKTVPLSAVGSVPETGIQKHGALAIEDAVRKIVTYERLCVLAFRETFDANYSLSPEIQRLEHELLDSGFVTSRELQNVQNRAIERVERLMA